MKFQIHQIAILGISLLVSVGANAQDNNQTSPTTQTFTQKATISGTVKDASNGETLIGALISVKDAKQKVYTNEYGYFSITLPKGTYTLVINYLGFNRIEKVVDLNGGNQTLSIDLESVGTVTKEVVISAVKEDENIKSTEMSTNRLDINTIKKMPALLGEVDVVRSITMLPGVSTVGEGASGFNVRGGAIDQNLVLLDEAPVYNSSHLFGFFSIFNPDAVKDVKLYKGGMPSQYGGRLSSVLDVRMKEGNSKRFSTQGGVGLIFSRLTIEGPLKKDKGSFIIAARRSYGDVFLKLSSNEDLKNSSLYFYDLSTKFNYKFGARNQVFLSGYLGRDKFGVPAFGFNWGNSTATARWNHVFGSKLFSNLTAFYSNYDYELGTLGSSENVFNWKSRLINYSGKYEFNYFLNPNNTITFGAQALYYEFRPAKIVTKTKGQANPDVEEPYKFALENAIFVGNEQKVSARMSLTYGLRLSNFNNIGAGKIYTLQDQAVPTDGKKVIDSVELSKGEFYNPKFILEPRFSAKYDLNEVSSIKASYNRNAQYIHLLSNTAASVPLDIWTPSNTNLKPQIANQVALGYFRNFKENTYETSVEAFYKTMDNQLDYIYYADILGNQKRETQILTGSGRAYGAEFYLKKSKGKLTGWISYTLARTERKVNGLSQNEWYPSRFDKAHTLNVVAMYKIKERLTFSVNNTYSSGTPITLGNQIYEVYTQKTLFNPSETRNNFRIPAYFRADIALTYERPKKKPEQRWESEWVFSIYNLSNRRNPFTVFIQADVNNPDLYKGYKYSVFGSIIPGITYNFKY